MHGKGMYPIKYIKYSLVVVASVVSTSAHALFFNENVTSNQIQGTGVTNGGYTVDRQNNVELGLRGKIRFPSPSNSIPSNGDGTYSFVTGGPSATKAWWSFDWSINSALDGLAPLRTLNALTYVLGIDQDASQGTAFSTFDPINDLNPDPSKDGHWDHSMGYNTTGQSLGDEATSLAEYNSYIATRNLAQQSWQAHWYIPGIDPNLDGTYDFYLSALDDTGNELARTEMQIIVGKGGSAVPDSSSMFLMLAASLTGLVGFRRFRGIR